jgi:hypothetical protein
MKIGSLQLGNPVILAPMAGITDLPYRLIAKRFGFSLVFTEMISANGLFYGGSGTDGLLLSCPEEKPLGVQLFGEDPLRLADAARRVEGNADLIDLNCGCPVKKVVGSGAGSALLRDPLKIAAIVGAVRKATNRPLTIKLRSGWDDSSRNYLDVARRVVDEGIDAITLHPRTRSQMFGGKADWSDIARLKESVEVPVIASGDLFTADDALAVFKQTGCDAVMVARGGYGNPWLGQQILDRLAGRQERLPTPVERLRCAGEHLELFLATYGPARTLAHMRKHLCWYTHGLPSATGFRQHINQIRTFPEMQELLATFTTAVTGKS